MAHVYTVARHCRPAQRSLSGIIRTRLDIWRSRRALAKLDARALEDIGVSRAEARREARLGFWDAPSNWHDN